MSCSIARPREAFRLVGKGKTAGYGDVLAGLLPPPVKIGARASAFIVAELETVNRARAASLDDDAVRDLVKLLVATRGPDRDDDDVRRIAAEFHATRLRAA